MREHLQKRTLHWDVVTVESRGCVPHKSSCAHVLPQLLCVARGGGTFRVYGSDVCSLPDRSCTCSQAEAVFSK